MFQQFYTDTLGARFIKTLLATTPLPVFDSVVDGDQLVEGSYYVYNRFIIKCVKGGLLMVSSEETLYPSDTLYPSAFLAPGWGIMTAQFYVLSTIEHYDPQYFSTYDSSVNYYDPETHKQLGKYLRYIRTTTGLNLLPYYNCFSSEYISDVTLERSSSRKISLTRQSSSVTKVIAVPIQFGHTYTVALDCYSQVLMRACVYPSSGFIEETPTSFIPQSVIDVLQESGTVYSHCSFKSPVTFRVECGDPQVPVLNKMLYLLIQVPRSNNSAVVVLDNFEQIKGVVCDENTVRQYGVLNPSLLRMNGNTSFAFSDRLIEYLVQNVIHSGEYISKNIEKVQTALCNTFKDYQESFDANKSTFGIWDKNIASYIMQLANERSRTYVLMDQDGFVNKDIEEILYTVGGAY